MAWVSGGRGPAFDYTGSERNASGVGRPDGAVSAEAAVLTKDKRFRVTRNEFDFEGSDDIVQDI